MQSYNKKLEILRQNKNILYDYLYENNLDWPCISCKWGSLITQNKDYIRQKVYFACRTDGVYYESENFWKRQPSFLVVATVEFPQIDRQFNHDFNNIFLSQNTKRPNNLKAKKIIIHPGDPSIIKTSFINNNWILTKSDGNQAFIWNLEKHKYIPSNKENIHADIPDLTLFANQKLSQFAIDWAKQSHRVASGGYDKLFIWDLEDYQTSISNNFINSSKRELNSINNMEQNLRLNYKTELNGHEGSIEGLSFSPKDKDLLVSVGVDKKIIGWDIRSNTRQMFQMLILMTQIAQIGIKLLYKCLFQDDNIIASGSADGTCKIFDIRNIKKQLQLYKNISEKENNPIQCIQFNPLQKDNIGVSSDNLRFYNISNEQPIFTHLNPKETIFDFDHNHFDKFSIISTMQDSEENGAGGGLIHLFRPIDLLNCEQNQAIEKLHHSLK